MYKKMKLQKKEHDFALFLKSNLYAYVQTNLIFPFNNFNDF